MDITAVAKPLLLELLKDPEVRSAIEDYIHDANTDAVHNWCDSNASNKIKEHLETNIDVGDSVNEVITNGSFDISFSG